MKERMLSNFAVENQRLAGTRNKRSHTVDDCNQIDMSRLQAITAGANCRIDKHARSITHSRSINAA
jgi:hypothetical protein